MRLSNLILELHYQNYELVRLLYELVKNLYVINTFITTLLLYFIQPVVFRSMHTCDARWSLLLCFQTFKY